MITEYTRVTSPEEALRKKLELGSSAKFLAGGTEIMRLGSTVSCKQVISLQDTGLSTVSAVEGRIRIGSCVTFQQLIDHEDIPGYLKEALSFCGSFTRRNMATIGGNIAVSRDDSYVMPTLIAAKARLIIADITPNGLYTEEDIPIREYHAFRDHFTHSLILAIVLNKPTRFVSSVRFARTKQSPAAVTLAFGADISSSTPHDLRICAAVKGTGVVRILSVEEGISSGVYQKAEDVASDAALGLTLVADITGTEAYKKYILGVGVSNLYASCLATLSTGGGK